MPSKAWVVRGGRFGEAEQQNLAQGRVTIGWREIGDLTPCSSRDQVRQLVEAAYPGDHPGRQAIFTGQLWAFRQEMQPGDLILMPLKSQPGLIAFGRCADAYAFDPDAEPDRRHHRAVAWREDLVPRTALQGDLLAMVNASLTVFSPSRNRAAERLESVAETGIDPGPSGRFGEGTQREASKPEDLAVTDPPSGPTLDAIRDQIRDYVTTRFREHELTWLVAAILEASGFTCDVSPAGPDGGVDILANGGPMGFGSPTVVVEVKSEPGAVGSTVLRTLHSALTRYGADYGVLVAWGGVTRPAMTEFAHLRGKLRVWDSESLLEKLFDVYPRLPESIRSRIPLKQVWVLDEG